MKRDMDLIRKLLLYLEAKADDRVEREVSIAGYDPVVINHHLRLLARSNLIDYEASKSTSNPNRLIAVYPSSLTWEGHEFLETARDDQTWNKAKAIVQKVTGGISLDILRALLTAWAMDALKING